MIIFVLIIQGYIFQVIKEQVIQNFFWKLGMSSVNRFFDLIYEKNLLPLSLSMSKEVMIKRNWLFASVQSSRQRINDTFDLLEESNNLLNLIKKNQKLLDENGSFVE